MIFVVIGKYIGDLSQLKLKLKLASLKETLKNKCTVVQVCKVSISEDFFKPVFMKEKK